MFPDETSITRQRQREANFSPPYCPRPTCAFHSLSSSSRGSFIKCGIRVLKRFPYSSQRFRCSSCRKSFSASFFSLHYRQKIWGLNEKIFQLHSVGVSKRQTARFLAKTEHLIRIRLSKMARQGLLLHARSVENLKITEPIVYDGLENFSFSQFDPNNINHAVGKSSLFTYDFNFSPLNRKGRMSPWQQEKKARLEGLHGPYPKNAIRESTKKIFSRLLKKSSSPLVIYSDKHYLYKCVVQQDLAPHSIEHIAISSKITRNYQNPLFPVNNIDLQARHNLAAFKRETIAFSKHSIAMQESFLLYMLHRNYLRPKFWGTHRSDPECSRRSPAMELGIAKKIYTFQDFFQTRILPTQVSLHEEWNMLFRRIDQTSRRTIASRA